MHTPVNVITIERETGSRGGEFAHNLAAHLGWRLLDSELIAEVAQKAGVNPETAAKYDERLDPWYYRYGKAFWHDSLYPVSSISDDQIFDSDRMLALIRQQILESAKVGHCVLVGRGAACALAGHPGCFHVFVYATAKAKREWFVHAYPKQAEHSDQLLLAADKRRAAVIRKAYEQEWCCRSLYHLQLNSAIGTEAMLAAVEGAAGIITKEEEVATHP